MEAPPNVATFNVEIGSKRGKWENRTHGRPVVRHGEHSVRREERYVSTAEPDSKLTDV